MKRKKVIDILESSKVGDNVLVKGWVRAFRSNRFIQINDGSTIKNIQAVIDFEKIDDTLLKRISVASSISVSGEIVESQGSGQSIEIKVNSIEIIGDANPDEVQKTVMQPKKHSLEFFVSNHICVLEQIHLVLFLEFVMH